MSGTIEAYASVIITHGNEVLLLRSQGKSWQLPSTVVDPSRDMQKTVAGYASARLGRVIPSSDMQLITTVQDWRSTTSVCCMFHVFRCITPIRFAPRPTDSYDEWRFFPSSGLPAEVPIAHLVAARNYFANKGFEYIN